MQALKSQTALRRGGIVYLRTDELTPNPVQPRKRFDDESLEELSGSIKSYGILNPLTVRLRCGKYELVAGERRLRAAKLAGLEEVPCILIDVNMEDASLIALVENLQRRDLDFIEEALGISQLIRMFGMSQEEAARRIGKSQSAVANKLRLLKLPSDVLESLRQNGLTERHGRALLRLPNPVAQRAALEYIVDNGLTVAATDAYIDALLSAPEEVEQKDEEKPEKRRTFVLKDVRVFLNTLSRSIDLMKQGGIDAGIQREETDDSLILTISIPKARQPSQNG
jgi:ParB family chromosome partitioning protein